MFVYPSLLRTQSIISILAVAIYLVYYLIVKVDNLGFEKDMSALARIEIAASPEVVRKVVSFPNFVLIVVAGVYGAKQTGQLLFKVVIFPITSNSQNPSSQA